MKQSVDSSFWEHVDPELFLENDRGNSTRETTARIVRELCPASMIEIGVGTGIDYEDHFRHIKGLEYRGVDISVAFVQRLIQRNGSERFQYGTFDDLTPASFDIVYTKATLEHQPSFIAPLRSMLSAARRCVLINWYLPPGDDEHLSYNEAIKVHYNCYAKTDVVGTIESSGWVLSSVVTVEGSTNELWILSH